MDDSHPFHSSVPFDVARFPQDPRPVSWRQPVVAIGNFDGVHRGHLKILDRVCRRADERGGSPLVLTFDPHPPRVIRPDRAPALLMTPEQRIAALRHVGVAGVAVVTFTAGLAQWAPERFVQDEPFQVRTAEMPSRRAQRQGTPPKPTQRIPGDMPIAGDWDAKP